MMPGGPAGLITYKSVGYPCLAGEGSSRCWPSGAQTPSRAAASPTIEGLSPQRLTLLEHITTEALAGVYQPLDALGADCGSLHPLQEAFHRRHALQCGFCMPGMIMVLKDFLEENPEPTRAEVRRAIAGNLCRCTGYQHIIDAAMDAAGQMHAQAGAPRAAPGNGEVRSEQQREREPA